MKALLDGLSGFENFEYGEGYKQVDDFMSVEIVMLEWAVLEEIKMVKNEKSWQLNLLPGEVVAVDASVLSVRVPVNMSV